MDSKYQVIQHLRRTEESSSCYYSERIELLINYCLLLLFCCYGNSAYEFEGSILCILESPLWIGGGGGGLENGRDLSVRGNYSILLWWMSNLCTIKVESRKHCQATSAAGELGEEVCGHSWGGGGWVYVSLDKKLSHCHRWSIQGSPSRELCIER